MVVCFSAGDPWKFEAGRMSVRMSVWNIVGFPSAWDWAAVKGDEDSPCEECDHGRIRPDGGSIPPFLERREPDGELTEFYATRPERSGQSSRQGH